MEKVKNELSGFGETTNANFLFSGYNVSVLQVDKLVEIYNKIMCLQCKVHLKIS